jgi:hypothetical protein
LSAASTRAARFEELDERLAEAARRARSVTNFGHIPGLNRAIRDAIGLAREMHLDLKLDYRGARGTMVGDITPTLDLRRAGALARDIDRARTTLAAVRQHEAPQPVSSTPHASPATMQPGAELESAS